MNKIAPLKFTFEYLNTDDSVERLSRTYSLLFLLAKKNIIDKQRLEENIKDKQIKL